MALESVVFQQDPFAFSNYGFSNDLHSHDCPWQAATCGSAFEDGAVRSEMTLVQNEGLISDGGGFFPREPPLDASSSCRRGGQGKRRRKRRRVKDREAVESQRMTHIFVERNRRKQMNDHLSLLRSLMPPSYAQRGDQASVVGGAINCVKELEQLLQTLEAQKRISHHAAAIFSGFFSFPQYSTYSKPAESITTANNNNNNHDCKPRSSLSSSSSSSSSAAVDVEVTMAESHATLKIQSTRIPKQLFKMVTGLHSLGLHVLHLRVTTFDHQALYTISVKVEEDSQVRSVDEIAAAVFDMMGRIQQEAAAFISI